MSSLDSWHEEKQSAWLYRALAACEPDAKIAELFRALAAAADFQAEKWLASAGQPAPPAFAPSARAHITAGLARAFGPRRVRHMLAAMKVRGLSVYDSQRSLAGHLMPTSVKEVGARHKGHGGGNLRAAVFGVNDGLVSNTSLIMGVAGAAAGADFVLTSGVAGLLAGALSMAAGEYVSMRSQREMFEYQIGLERDELQEYPEEEAEELALIVRRSAHLLNCAIVEDGATEIARRSRGTPRISNRLLRRVRDYAEVKADGRITRETADAALTMLDVDHLGLDVMDRKLLGARRGPCRGPCAG